MPNWCSNSIVIKGDEEKIKTILKKLGEINDPSKAIIFETLVGKSPDGHEVGWHNSNLKWWGTESDVAPEDSNIKFSNNEIRMTPVTAWSPPSEFCHKLSTDYGVVVEIMFFEPGCNFAGIETYDNDSLNAIEYDFLEGMYILDKDRFWKQIPIYFPNVEKQFNDSWFSTIVPFISNEDKIELKNLYHDYIVNKY